MIPVARISAVAMAAGLAGGCAAPPSGQESTGKAASAPAAAVVARLSNSDFEADPLPGRACPPSWGCSMHADTTAFAFEVVSDARPKGRYLRITRVKPEPWAMATQAVPGSGLAGRRVRLSVDVLAEALEGGAGPAVVLQGTGGRVLDARQSLVARGPGWRRASAEIEVAAGTERVELGLHMEGGGWVGFDNVELVVLPPAGR